MKHLIFKVLMVLTVLIFSTSIASAASDVQLKDYNTVPTLTQGKTYSIYGLIESKKKMSRVEIGVVEPKANKWVIRYDKKINTDNFSISKADSTIKFGTLKPGTYKYRIYAHVNKKVYTLLNQSFTVKAKPVVIKTVKEQQEFLNKVNEGSIIGKLAVDGKTGPATIASIKIFQQLEGLDVDGKWGVKTETASNKTIKVDCKRKACNWACSVANDNSFAYGTGQRAHRSGCYYCKTNTGDRKWTKEKKGEPHYVKDSNGKKHTYTKTYCCNPFITAAYAHGAKDTQAYKWCHAGSSWGMTCKEWKRSPYFSTVGACKNVPYSKLKAGDVILSNKNTNGWRHHVWMYIGHGRYVDATLGNWSADSIAVRGSAKSNYEKFQKHTGCYVMRYSK